MPRIKKNFCTDPYVPPEIYLLWNILLLILKFIIAATFTTTWCSIHGIKGIFYSYKYYPTWRKTFESTSLFQVIWNRFDIFTLPTAPPFQNPTTHSWPPTNVYLRKPNICTLLSILLIYGRCLFIFVYRWGSIIYIRKALIFN